MPNQSFGADTGFALLLDTSCEDVIHFVEVQQDFFLPLGKQVMHRIAQGYAAFTVRSVWLADKRGNTTGE
jgi:hypothetical protein